MDLILQQENDHETCHKLPRFAQTPFKLTLVMDKKKEKKDRDPDSEEEFEQIDCQHRISVLFLGRNAEDKKFHLSEPYQLDIDLQKPTDIIVMVENLIINKLAIICQVTIFEVYKTLDADTGRVFHGCREPKFRDD